MVSSACFPIVAIILQTSRILNSLWQVFSPFLCINIKINSGSMQWQAAIRSNVAEDVPQLPQKHSSDSTVFSLECFYPLPVEQSIPGSTASVMMPSFLLNSARISFKDKETTLWVSVLLHHKCTHTFSCS